MISGFDASSCQGIISPAVCSALAARGTRFAYVKATTGNDGKDPCFDENVANLRAAGIACGAYHFFYAIPVVPGHASRDPIAQAQAFWTACDGLGSQAGELPPLLDLESPLPQDWAKWGTTAQYAGASALAWLGKVAALSGRTPGVYTMPYFAQAARLPAAFANYWLHAAEYDVLQPISPWGGWTILQSAGGKPTALSRRYQQATSLPNGVPADTDVIADEATFQRLLSA